MNAQTHLQLSELIQALEAQVAAVASRVRAAYPEGSRPARGASMLEGGLAKLSVELERRTGHEIHGDVADVDLYHGESREAARDLISTLYVEK